MSRAERLGSKLRKAARLADLQAVRKILAKGADVNSRSKATGWTALHNGVNGENANHYSVVLELIEAGADVNAQDSDGETPLHLAARRGDSYMVDVLLKAGADVNIENSEGQTPAMVVPKKHRSVALKLQNWHGGASRGGLLFGRTIPGLNSTTIGEQKKLMEGRAEGERELREAARDGDIDGVIEVLEIYPDIDIDAANEDGWNALVLSVYEGHAAVAKFLLKEGANPNYVEKNEYQTPLHIAAATGSASIVEDLLTLDEPAQLDVVDSMGRTPLFLAALKGQAHVVRVLLEFDADCSIGNIKGRLPLHAAVQESHTDVIKALLDAVKPDDGYADIIDHMDIDGRTALHEAAVNGNVLAGDMLIKAGSFLESRDKMGLTPLFVASEKGFTRFAALLLEDHNADANAPNLKLETPLYVASVKGHEPMVKLLLTYGADPETTLLNGFTPLMAAAQEGRIAIMSELVAHGADIHAANSAGETALLIAALEGYSNAVAFLVHNGAKILRAEIRGLTALHVAARDGHVGVVRVLLAVLETRASSGQGLKASQSHLQASTRGETALHFAARYGHTAVVDELLLYDRRVAHDSQGASGSGITYGAMIDIPNKHGWTALHCAVDGEQHGAVSLLISHGANVNAADTFGITPLHLAGRKADQRFAMMLLSTAATDVRAVNAEGKTALHFAAGCVRANTVRVLLDEDADPHAQDKQGWTPHMVLGKQQECNPSYVQAEGMCTSFASNGTTIYNGDMCPLPLGGSTEQLEANVLLQVAMSKTQPAPAMPAEPISISSDQPPPGEAVTIPLVATLVPGAFLILFFIAILFTLYRRVQSFRRMQFEGNCSSHVCCKGVHSCCAESSEDHQKKRLSSLWGGNMSMDAPSDMPIHTHQGDQFDYVLNSQEWAQTQSKEHFHDSDDASEESTCGWSESTDDVDHAVQDKNIVKCKSKGFSVVRISGGSASDGDVSSQESSSRGEAGSHLETWNGTMELVRNDAGVPKHGHYGPGSSHRQKGIIRQWSWS